MGDLVGDRIFDKFGSTFPLLIKFIDANEALSIQVHPDDDLAQKRHNSFGKTEMWYVMQADKNAELIIGFNRDVNKETYLKHLEDKKLMAILNTEPVEPADVFFLPPKRVHAIGAGILLAEIQQTSDVTYRIYDFDRKDSDGNYRDLHTELAVDSIDYKHYSNYKTEYTLKDNEPSTLVNCQYFHTGKINLTQSIDKDIHHLDSFVIYLCTEGSCDIEYYDNEIVNISKGDTVLIPSSLTMYSLNPSPKAELLEVYVPETKKKE
jgi:mannose-6-phosphate isomerase